MKRLFKIFLTSLLSVTAYAQGPIAHWNMNGNVYDITGNGHDGHANNVISVAGKSGLPNTAYYFNGINSSITAPYMPDLNFTQYTICATVKVSGFYTGLCQSNTIITRGAYSSPGSFTLFFYDNPFDGNNCYAVDTSKDVFVPEASSFALANNSLYQYTPTVVENEWYYVITIWDGTNFKIYINDTLKMSNVISSGLLGTSIDSISIGYDIFEAGAGYPYPFKGIIDDIVIYNRVLSDSEINHYSDTCGQITSEPVAETVSSGHNAIFTVSSSISSPNYQWQQDAGIGYINLSNSGPYSGVNTNTLMITGVTSTMNNYHYRCYGYNESFCSDTSSGATLTYTTGVGSIVPKSETEIYPNPANNSISIKMSFIPANGNIELLNNIGQVLASQKITSQITNLNIEMQPPGLYLVRIKSDETIEYNKFIKNR